MKQISKNYLKLVATLMFLQAPAWSNGLVKTQKLQSSAMAQQEDKIDLCVIIGDRLCNAQRNNMRAIRDLKLIDAHDPSIHDPISLRAESKELQATYVRYTAAIEGMQNVNAGDKTALKTLLKNGGKAFYAGDEDEDAVKQFLTEHPAFTKALAKPFLEESIDNAKGLLDLKEIQEAGRKSPAALAQELIFIQTWNPVSREMARTYIQAYFAVPHGTKTQDADAKAKAHDAALKVGQEKMKFEPDIQKPPGQSVVFRAGGDERPAGRAVIPELITPDISIPAVAAAPTKIYKPGLGLA